jgi:hypothetical protein
MRVKKLLKVFAYSLFGFVVFLLLLAGATQTQFFRDRLRTFALSRLGSLLDAQVQLGTITGNLVSGFSIDHLSIKVQHDFLIVAERLDLRYDLFEIPGKTISVDNLTLVKPNITLLRGRDSLWNFERMIRPTTGDTAASEPFDWTIQLKNLRIEDGSVVLVDSASLASPDHSTDEPYYVEYHNVALRNFTLETSLTISQNEKHAVISTVKFNSNQPDFELRQLAGDFRVTGSDARVENMVLETGASNIRLDAEMKDFSLFDGIELEQLQKKHVALSLHAREIDLNELKRFIPQIGFLSSKVSLDLITKGEFGELDIKSLDLKSGESEFHIAGTLFNLHTPSKLYLDTKFERSIVYSPDAQAILPTFNLPDLRRLGRSKLNLTFAGTPLDFRTRLILETDAGTVHADGTLKIGGPNRLQYNCEVKYRGLNLAAITTLNDLASSLNGALHIEGKGVSLDNLNATLDVGLDSSEIAGRHVGKTQFRIDGIERKLTASGILGLETAHAKLNATLDQKEKDTPSFSLEGTVSSLNLHELFRESSPTCDLNFGITAHGTGLTWSSLNGEFLLDFLPSVYREYRIDSSAVRIVIDQENQLRKQLALTSSIADFSLTGRFDTEYMKDLITYELLNLRKAVGEKFVSLDSTLGSNIDPGSLTALGKKLSAQHDDLNAAFSLHIKDLEPISVATGNRTFNGVGVLAGTMQGNFHDLSLSARLDVDDFYYGSADSGILIHDGTATLDVASLKPSTPLKDIGIRFVANAGNVHINRSEIDSLRTTFKYEQEYSSYTSAGLYNRDTRVVIKGFSSISEDYLEFTLNNLELGYKDFAWKAEGGATVGFGARGVRVSHLTMRRDTQVVSLSGAIIKGESLTGTLVATNINLEDINYFLTSEELGPKREAFTGLANLDLSASGTLQRPAYSASLTAQRVSFRGVPLGNVNGMFQYQDQYLSTSVSVMNGLSARPNLAVKGTIPMNLALARTEASHAEKPMNLQVQSEGIQIGMLDPILPTFNQLTGIMKCDVTVKGSPKHPDYSGALSIDSCSFIFVPNLVSYTFGGQFQFRGDRIHVMDAAVQSKPLDDQFKRAGLIHLAGDFALRDFKPSDFNLTANGGLLVVREATRKSSLSVYGNLFIETGPSGLRYTGEIEQSQLKGYVLVKNSSLIFPPAQQVVNEQLSNTVPVRIVDDTTRKTTPQTRPLVGRYFGMEGETEQADVRNGNEQQPSKSFVDGIRYDLDIECAGGNTEIRMIFNSATSEELVANINGKFSISEDGKRWIGTMTIDRAYYRFIKQFNADGTIKYSGDFLNPELDITATYEGFRTSVDSTSSNRPEKVVVSMKITGTRLAPKLEWSMTIDDVDYYSYKGTTSSDVQTDALTFILAGTFPLSRSQANDLAVDLGPTARSSLFTGAGSLFTNALSDFLRRETGFIYSIELSYGTQSSFGEAADIRLSGPIGDGIWRYGGKILNDPFSNANVSLLYSFGDIFERPSLRNFMFELERKVETSTIGEASDKKQVNSARLFYRFSF